MSTREKRLVFGKKLSPKVKTISISIVIILTIALLAFAEVIRPNQDAASYTNRLETASKPLDLCFGKLAETTQQDIFYAPDIDLKLKQANVKKIQDQITACRVELDHFRGSAQDLLALHLAGYTKTYREAQVNQKHAYNMVSQSSDVMNQYSDMADFLAQYYNSIATFLNAYDALNTAEEKGTVSNRNHELNNQANALRASAHTLRGLSAPTGFAPSQRDAATMVEQAAVGFDNLAKGFDSYSDTYQNLGYKQLDAAVSSYDNAIIGQPFAILKDSYILKQINGLQSKVENLLSAETE